MTALRIASHRYGLQPEVYSSTIAHVELVAEYRKLLIGPNAQALYSRYVKIIPQLLDCQSAILVYVLDASRKEIVRYDKHDDLPAVLDPQFAENFGTHKVRTVNSMANNPQLGDVTNVKAHAAIAIEADGLRLAILVATDNRERSWSQSAIDSLEDISQMLRADLEVTRERHLIAIQKRMQRSLVSLMTMTISIALADTIGTICAR